MGATKFIFIIAAGHSGSTLLDLILGSHRDGFSLGEIDHFDKYFESNQNCSCGRPFHSCAVWSRVAEQLLGREREAGRNFRTSLKRSEQSSFLARLGQIVSLVSYASLPKPLSSRITKQLAPELSSRAHNTYLMFDQIRRITGAKFLVDSSKSMHRMRLIRSSASGSCKVIFLTRDGRAVMASFMKRGGFSALSAARRWRLTQWHSKALRRSFPNSEWINVRYEALCRNPEKTIRQIHSFLDVEFRPEALAFRSKQHHLIGGNRMRLGSCQQIRESQGWRRQLQPTDLAIFDRVAGRLNRRLLGEYFVP